MDKKETKHHSPSCMFNKGVTCFETDIKNCENCGFYKGVGEKRLAKRFSPKTIKRMKNIKFRKADA